MEIEFTYNTLSSLIAAAEKSGLPVSRLVLMQQAEQMEQSEDEIYRHMEETYRVMASCIEPGCARTCAAPAASPEAALTR